MLPFLVVLREPKRTLQEEEEDEKAYVERKLKKYILAGGWDPDLQQEYMQVSPDVPVV